MRNLLEHPVTREEMQLQLVKLANDMPATFGDIKPMVLRKLAIGLTPEVYNKIVAGDNCYAREG